MWKPSWQRMQNNSRLSLVAKSRSWALRGKLAYGSAKGELTEEMMDVVFEIALAQHSQKIDWR